MDLIYADKYRQDIGVINSYDLDMAYGKDENDFTCSVDRNDHCCSEDYLIYAENTDYGGIVDRIKVDTENDAIIYMGRTWHGVLEGKVISPNPGDDYLVVSGEANEVLQVILERIGLSGLFAASSEDTDIEISNYQFDRYVYAYTGIKKMLKEYSLKLILRWQNNVIVASAEPVHDYSQDEEFDTSQVNFVIERNYRPVNHIICLGQGDLKDRAVIHIFADENGGIQPYLLDPDADPVEDADYILDTSQQVLTGQDEVIEIYDIPNAEITTNYVPLTSQPADWEDNCTGYYYYDPSVEVEDSEELETGGEYKQVELLDVGYILQAAQPADWSDSYGSYFTYDPVTDQYTAVTGTDAYDLLTAKPGNWSKAYSTYYRQSGSSYVAVTGTVTTRYTKQKKQPSDWKKSYSKYYFLYSDGVTTEYRAVSGVTYYVYKQQSRKPSDWSTAYGSYFRRATAKELQENKSKQWYAVTKTKKDEVPGWKAKKYYTKVAYSKAPEWSQAARYTRTDTTAAPAWVSGTYYQKRGAAAPAWAADTYYTKSDLKIPPEWVSGMYFRQAIDRYAVMVAGAVDKLEEYNEADDLAINLEETDQIYDVGDIVGAREEVTGMESIQEVTKKIITIKNDDIVIRYEVD